MPKTATDIDPIATKRSPLNMRTTETLRALLAEAATRNGRSLTQEVEFRIEQSFRDDRIEAMLTEVIGLLNRKARK